MPRLRPLGYCAPITQHNIKKTNTWMTLTSNIFSDGESKVVTPGAFIDSLVLDNLNLGPGFFLRFRFFGSGRNRNFRNGLSFGCSGFGARRLQDVDSNFGRRVLAVGLHRYLQNNF